MLDDQSTTYYELLDVAPDASPQEIRAAYLRAKSAYKKDSVALYTLINQDETEELLQRVEEAYLILSNPEKRRQYDRIHGLLLLDETLLAMPRPERNQKIVSIDRVPPMESVMDEADILVPPSTDFTASTTGSATSYASTEVPLPSLHAQPAPTPPSWPSQSHTQTPPLPTAGRATRSLAEKTALLEEIEREVEWKGPFLRKLRESRNISIEELSDHTKISKTYLLAIEDENFAKLPAAVFLRGFVIQIAKLLKLPHEKVAAAYLARYNQALREKEQRKG